MYGYHCPLSSSSSTVVIVEVVWGHMIQEPSLPFTTTIMACMCIFGMYACITDLLTQFSLGSFPSNSSAAKTNHLTLPHISPIFFYILDFIFFKWWSIFIGIFFTAASSKWNEWTLHWWVMKKKKTITHCCKDEGSYVVLAYGPKGIHTFFD